VPTRNGTGRKPNESQEALLLDLAVLGLRTRAGGRGHDLRRTFITLAQVDGAVRFKLEAVTHGPRGEIIGQYTSYPWPALCAEVAKLKVCDPRGRARRPCYIVCYGSTSDRQSLGKESDPDGI
jgi:hypothetical protein